MSDQTPEFKRRAANLHSLQEELNGEYKTVIPNATMFILDRSIKQALHNQNLYYQIEKATKVWWPIVAWIHYYFMDYEMVPFRASRLGIKTDRLSKSLANSCSPAPDTFEESMIAALKGAFQMDYWLRYQPFEQIINIVSINLSRVSNNIYVIGDMMSLGSYGNMIPPELKETQPVGFIPFFKYLLLKRLLDPNSKDILLPRGSGS